MIVDPADGDRVAAIRERLADVACARMHPQLQRWTAAAGRRAHVLEDIDAALLRCADRAIARRVADRFAGPDAPTDAYLGRLLVVDGAHALTGIRFKGLRPDDPFVELVAADIGPADPAFLDLLAAIRRAWAPLRPRALRLWLASHESTPDLRLEGDMRTIVAPIAELQALPPPPHRHALTLRRCADLEFYPRFRAAYDAYLQAHPALAAGMYLSSAADLAPVVAEGHTYEAWSGDRWAGLVAAASTRYCGRGGWLVHEELLAAEFRGRGLAPGLQRGLVDRLGPADGALLVGTIHADNHPSLATARRVGRLDVGGHVFVTA